MKKTFLFLMAALAAITSACSMASDEQDVTFSMTATSFEEGGGAKVTLQFENEDVFLPIFWAQLSSINDDISQQISNAKFFQNGEMLPLGGKLFIDKDIAEIDIPDLEAGDYRIMVSLSKGSYQHSETKEFYVQPKVEVQEPEEEPEEE